MTDFLHVAGWDAWTDEAGDQPWVYQSDGSDGYGYDMRLLAIHRGKALALTIGFNDDGPIVEVRAFDGETKAIVGMTGWDGDMTISVAETKDEDF